MKEADLYLPVKSFLEQQGYEVKGEVRDCDVVAIRGAESPVVVELKLALNLNLILQAVARLSLTDKVYICVPKSAPLLKSKQKHVLRLLRRLGLGLITVSERQFVDAVLDPAPYQPRKSTIRKERLLSEFAQRVGDPNRGGAHTRSGLVTAYRQRAIRIATLLARNGPSKAAAIAAELNEPKARAILYRDVYGWFDRIERGIYALSPRGITELQTWKENQEGDQKENQEMK